MAIIRYKFRSCVDYDAINIDPHPSIAVRDLKAEIARRNNLNLSQGGFDLRLFDPFTGQEYRNGDYYIPGGTSVIVKRVPAVIVPSPVMEHVNLDDKLKKRHLKLDNFPASVYLPVEENLHAFGENLSQNSETSVAGPGLKIDEDNCLGDTNSKPFNASIRDRTQKLDSGDFSGRSSGGANYLVAGEKVQMPTMEVKGGADMKHRKMGSAHCPGFQSVDLTFELQCAVCKALFKEVVMIPCYQHSSCDNCMSKALDQTARCPNCTSNISLRGAIRRFVESRLLTIDEDQAMLQYVPDEESGIQGVGHCCDMTTEQVEFKMPVSLPITERGCNQVIGESEYELQIRNKRRQVPYNNEVGDKRFMGGSRHHEDSAYPNILPRDQGHHSNFTFGFPDDFIRSCPVAPNLATMPLAGNPMFPWAMPGYCAYDNFGPYGGVYDNFGMMYFNSAMPPTLQHVVRPSMPSMPNGQLVSRVRTGSCAAGVTSNSENTDHHRRQSSAVDVKVPSHHKGRSNAEADDSSFNLGKHRESGHRICHRASRDNEGK